jgi:hypothetical protein
LKNLLLFSRPHIFRWVYSVLEDFFRDYDSALISLPSIRTALGFAQTRAEAPPLAEIEYSHSSTLFFL